MFSIFEVIPKASEQKPIIFQIRHVPRDVMRSLFHIERIWDTSYICDSGRKSVV